VDEGIFNPGANLPQSALAYGAQQVVICIDTSASTVLGNHSFARGSRSGVPLFEESVVPAEQQVEKTVETKHILAAEVEGAARILKTLASHMRNPVDVLLICFSNDFQLPIDGQLKRTISSPDEMNALADNLLNILPTPENRGTNLAPALTKITEKLEWNKHTLLTILTDGQTSDATKSAEILQEMSKAFSISEVPFDIISVGAGSLGNPVQKEVPRFGATTQVDFLQSVGERISMHSNVFRQGASFSGAECNRGYLEQITLFHNGLGAGVYAGAYQDYKDLINVVEGMMTGVNDGKPMIFVESNEHGLWWPAKEHQYKFIAAITEADTSELDYHKNGFKAKIEKTVDGKVFVTDEFGRKRKYLLTPKNLVIATEIKPGYYQLASSTGRSYKLETTETTETN
jgi:hypothetical protein